MASSQSNGGNTGGPPIPLSREVYAIFSSIVPETGLPPDVLTGFLPPEDGTGRGEGHIGYTIRPKSNLPTGTEIRNIALISFDRLETIATNQIDPHDPAAGTDPEKEALNTIDTDAPTSAVNVLPTEVQARFEVSWSGSDVGAGIAGFDVYVASINGSDMSVIHTLEDLTPWILWINNTNETHAVFTGEPEKTYFFYSIARDLVGNVELTPVSPDALTTVLPSLTITRAAMDKTVECDGSGNSSDLHDWLEDHGGAETENGCGILTWSHNYQAGINELSDQCSATGQLMVTFIATDECSSEITTTATFSIVDTTPPTFSDTGMDLTIECPNVPVFTQPTAVDTCDANPDIIEVSDVTLPGTSSGLYSRSKSWKAVDDCGNESDFVNQTITVRDTTLPVIMLTGDAAIRVECHASYSDPGATALDNCDGITSVLVSGTVDANNVGDYFLIYTATDVSGNSGCTVRTVQVRDTTPPTLNFLWSDKSIECTENPEFSLPTIADACDDNPHLVEVDDKIVSGASPILYRRTKTWQAIDKSGNESPPASQILTVLRASNNSGVGCQGIDSDNDKLPDWWELLYFNSNIAGNPGDDTDQDGYLNITEYYYDGNPTNAPVKPVGILFENFIITKGWNLLSLPLTVNPPTVDQVFHYADPQNIWGWDNGQMTHVTTIPAGMGIWIYLSGLPPYLLQIVGNPSVSSTYQLYAGWNAVGPMAVSSITIPDDNRIDGSIWSWNGKHFRPVMKEPGSSLRKLEPGKGYFVHAAEAFDLPLGY